MSNIKNIPKDNYLLNETNNQNNINNLPNNQILNNIANNTHENNLSINCSENGAEQNNIHQSKNNSRINNERIFQNNNNNNSIFKSKNHDSTIIVNNSDDDNNSNSSNNNSNNNSGSNNSQGNIKASETLGPENQIVNSDNLINNSNSLNNNQINLGIQTKDIIKAKIPNPFFISPENNINSNQNNIILNNQGLNNDLNPINSNNQISFPLPDPNMVNIGENHYFSKYKKPALTGLEHLGDSSYLNAVLQLICTVKIFANFFLSKKNWPELYKTNPLAYWIHRLCTHIYPEENKKETYTGKKILGVLKNSSLVYNDNNEKNPNEFICFLLSKLNDEFSPNDDYNENLIYNYFTWIKSKETKIQNISKDLTYQKFQTFDLNISEVAKFGNFNKIKIKNCIDYYNNNPIIKIKYFNNQQYQEKITYKNQIYFYPEVFVFLADLKDNNIKFDIEKKIFLGNYLYPKNYELNGLVFFDLNKKKYNALCVSPVDKMWYLYDDENVKLFNFENFIGEYNKKNIYQPSILLYIRQR